MAACHGRVAARGGGEAGGGEGGAIRGYARGIRRIRGWFEAELRNLGVRSFPSAGNFLLANFGPQGPRLFHRLESEGILLRERTKDPGPGFGRLTLRTQTEMELFLKKMKRLGFCADTPPLPIAAPCPAY